MGVKRYRSIEDVPPAWREKDDPENLRLIAQALELYHRWKPISESKRSTVERFRSIEDLKSGRDDPYRGLSTARRKAEEPL